MTTRPKIAAALAGCLGAVVAATAANAAEVSLLSSTAMREVLEELVPSVRARERAQGRHHLPVRRQRLRQDQGGRDRRRGDYDRHGARRACQGGQGRGRQPRRFRPRPGRRGGARGRAEARHRHAGNVQERAARRQVDRLQQGSERRPFRERDESVSASPIRSRARLIQPELGVRVGALVAQGDAEIGVQQINELLHDRRHRFRRAVAERAADGADLFDGLPATAKEREVAGRWSSSSRRRRRSRCSRNWAWSRAN